MKRLFERDVDRLLDAGRLAAQAAAATAVAAEHAAEEVADVAEALRRSPSVVKRKLPLPSAAARPLRALDLVGVLPVVAVEVVLLALLRVGEDVVGGVDLLEHGLGGLVVGVDVRVVLARETAVGGANLLFGRLAVDAQDCVEVLRHEGQSSSV